MISLLKKELNTFFGSITGYLVIAIFLLTTSLFLWVIPNSFNIIDGQRSTLKGFFELAPWLYLFLIPAITMRMIAEEKRMGTIETLITRPISTLGIVVAKYLAALILVSISLIPTLLYFFSVYKLGNPVGNIDTGATWGSFIGLIFLASAYIAIGLFASSITSNQVISFLVAIILSYCCFLGFEYVSTIGFSTTIQNFFLKLGINEHYLSISRGIVDSRDLFYFIAISFAFLAFTRSSILRKKLIKQLTTKPIIFTAVFIVVSVASINYRLFRIDLTAEKRYSLSPLAKEIINEQKDNLTVEIYLTGDLPSGMKDFQEAIIDKLEDLNAYSPKRIFYHEFDVYDIANAKERDKTINELIESGIQPINLEHKTTEGLSTKQIFPGIIIQSNTKAVVLNLLKNNQTLSGDENLRQSIELLEFEFIKAIQSLQQKSKTKVAFLTGQGEANDYETGDIRYSLRANYEVMDITTQQLAINKGIETLIIADPQQEFSEQDKLYIDQFIMNGGKTLWCIDPVYASIDSLSKGYSTIAFERDLNLRDQLFRYGVRLNADLIQDAVCMEYPINTAPAGQTTNFTPAPFYYSPLATANPTHPMSRNLNNVFIEFPSSLDIVGEDQNRKTTSILTTSPYGRSVQTPVEVSLQSATTPPDRRVFNQPNIPIGILVEGKFESAFKNRMTQQLGINPSELKPESEQTKMVIIADGGIIKNKVRNRNGQVQLQPLGYDQFSGQTFGNKDFIMNCIDYLTDDQGIMQLRTRTVKLRMLDKVKIREEKVKWQLINIVSPLIIFALFGAIFYIIRKKKYNR